MAALEDSLSAPSLVGGRYRLLEPLGEGAVGVVFRALHVGLGREFALKILRPELAADPEALERFEREARILGQLRHPNVVDVTDFGIEPPADEGDGPRPFLVMELLAGETLADLCRREGALDIERALPILAAVGPALDAVHAAGILHRDLKPGNVMLARDAAGETVVKVLDFGLSGFFDRRYRSVGDSEGPAGAADETHFLLGTPLYTAPELAAASGRAGPAADVYSFGAMTYELLLGRPPFVGSARDVLLGHLKAAPPPPAALGVDLPAALWTALAPALAKDPALRPGRAGEIVAALIDAAVRVARRRLLPRRLGAAALLTAALGLVALALPASGVPPLERWLGDLRLSLAPRLAPDPRLLLVTLDEASLDQLRKPDGSALPLADPAWADELAQGLAPAFAAGAQGVAIDLVLGRGWQGSERFSSFLLEHADRLVLAVEADGGQVYGTAVADGLTAAALGARAARLFGYADLEEEADGVIRRGRTAFRAGDGTTFPSWAARAAALLGPTATSRPDPFLLDGRIDASYPRIPWRHWRAALARDPGLARGRLVLVGPEVSEDRHRIPGSLGRPQEVSGLVLQALFVDTLVRGAPIRAPRPGPFALAAVLLTGIFMVPILDRRRAWRAVAALGAMVLAYLAGVFMLFWHADLALPLTGPPLLAATGALLAVAARRWLLRPGTEMFA